MAESLFHRSQGFPLFGKGILKPGVVFVAFLRFLCLAMSFV
jgi:hypothetical protein